MKNVFVLIDTFFLRGCSMDACFFFHQIWMGGRFMRWERLNGFCPCYQQQLREVRRRPAGRPKLEHHVAFGPGPPQRCLRLRLGWQSPFPYQFSATSLVHTESSQIQFNSLFFCDYKFNSLVTTQRS